MRWTSTGEIVARPVGAMLFEAGTAYVYDSDELFYGEGHAYRVAVDPDDAVEMQVASLELTTDEPGWSVALRLDRSDVELAVEAWELFSDECWFYETATVGTSSMGEEFDEFEFDEYWYKPEVSQLAGQSWTGFGGAADSCVDLYVGRTDGNVQSILLRDDAIAWRVLGLEGTPPAEVLADERRFRACLDGERPVGPYGECLE